MRLGTSIMNTAHGTGNMRCGAIAIQATHTNKVPCPGGGSKPGGVGDTHRTRNDPTQCAHEACGINDELESMGWEV